MGRLIVQRRARNIGIGISLLKTKELIRCCHINKLFLSLKLTIHGILHCLWSADLSKSFSQLIVSLFTVQSIDNYLFSLFFQ